MKRYFSVWLVLFLILAPLLTVQAAGETFPGGGLLACPENSLVRVVQLNTGQILDRTSGLIIRVIRILPGHSVSSPSTPAPEPIPFPTSASTSAPAPVSDPVPASNPAPAPAPTPAKPAPAFQPAASDMTQEMLGYINAERARVNAPPLVLDESLCSGAYLKSKDMGVGNYFSHTSPAYGSPFAMMSSLGIKYQRAAENIAKYTSVSGAHQGLMNSPGHQANILNTNYKKIGLGFYRSGSYLYITQWFTN